MAQDMLTVHMSTIVYGHVGPPVCLPVPRRMCTHKCRHIKQMNLRSQGSVVDDGGGGGGREVGVLFEGGPFALIMDAMDFQHVLVHRNWSFNH